ncbi:hypothetical protein D9M73_209180 [compost metagenome]
MAGGADLADDFLAGTCTATAASGRYGANAFAFLALYADFAHRRDTLGDCVIAGRGLSAYSPQGQHGGLSHQHFFNQVHPLTLIVAYHTRAQWSQFQAARAGASITAKAGSLKQLHTPARACGIRSQPVLPAIQKFAGVVALIRRAGVSKGLRKRCGLLLSK